MKKLIRLLGTALLVAGMGIGGTALTAGAASADTGTQAANLQVSGGSWPDHDNCWNHDGGWINGGHDSNGDKCRDHHGRDGDRDHNDHHGDHRDHNDHHGDHGDHKGDGRHNDC
ncbi:hypothetical protein QFZ65_002726 [Arthrobacter sp. B3I9]|uniref:hypothetical protein n=1 Tax=Arthrobacter sp. B3I9 TaxID=3042270 RepID=UPI00278CED1C|nr:hypothetical protein [Arthrobacter sp. B3I9]MDQ0850788.1 hypothetical protein [Arthrobacter sp. B3I9]